MKTKFFNSIGFKILAIYSLLSLVTLSFVVTMIFENQADLISRNTKLEAERQLTMIISSLRKFTVEVRKGTLFSAGDSGEALKQTLDYLNYNIKQYAIFTEKGDVLHKSAEKMELPDTYVQDGMRSMTAMAFSGKEYYLRIDEKKQVMYCYLPLGGFQPGNSIILMKKDIGTMDRTLMDMYRQVVYVIVIVLCFHLIFAFILYRYIIHPVNLLTRSANDLAGGKLAARIPLAGRKDEFYFLASAFNSMADTLQVNFTALSSEADSARASAEKSERMITRDETTGLYNRAYFLERLGEELGKNRAVKPLIGLLLIEPDTYGEISQIYGRQTGNIMLEEASRTIVRLCRDADIAASFGDGMFAVLTAGDTADELKDVAERIRNAVHDRVVVTPDGDFRQTASIGVSCIDASRAAGTDPRRLYGSALEALRRARENGRNRTEIVV